MPSDLQALLAAVVADPADDVARLVYADCLEESGNAARAAFIRLQIEAERHHPDSNARAALDAQAQALFEQHWIEWWGEVCFSVGLPMPHPKPGGRLGRLASRVGMRAPPGVPYQRIKFRVTQAVSVSNPEALNGYAGAHFRRGFPDAVELNDGPHEFLPRWLRVSPLDSLTLRSSHHGYWFGGPHLACVRELSLDQAHVYSLRPILESPYCQNLESLRLELPDYYQEIAELLVESPHGVLFSAPRTRRLKRLSIRLVWEEAVAEAANAENLAGLTSLQVALASYHDVDPAGAGHRLAILARSPHLTGLKELAVIGALSEEGLTAAIQNPTWANLRKLELYLQNHHGRFDPFAGSDGLASLDELRLLRVRLSDAVLTALARSALLKRVRHFAFSGQPVDGTTLPKLAGALDRDRIETFTLLMPADDPFQEYAATLLHRWFGNRATVLLC